MTDSPESNTQLDAAVLEWIDRFAPYGVLTTDRELRVRGWNRWMEKHSALESKTVLGRRLPDLFPDLEQRRLMGQLERALQGEISVVSAALHGHLFPFKPVGREVDFRFMRQTARIAPLTTGSQINGIIIVIEDVTQREWQSEILARRHARDEILASALAHLLKAEDPRSITREVFCKVAEYLDFDSYLLYLFDAKASAFKLQSCGGVDPDQEQFIRAIPAQAISWVAGAGEGKAVTRDHIQASNDPLLAGARSIGLKAFVALPLLAGSALLGMLSFGTRTRNTIAPAETDLLSTIGQYLAVSLNRDKTDRELREAQEQLNKHAQELERSVADRTSTLKQIIAELQTFSYTIAHDLRAPIRALKGYCEVLIEDYTDDLPTDAVAIIGRLRNSSIQMDALTRDLLEFSQVSRQDLTLGPIDLSVVLAEVIALGGARFAACAVVRHPLHMVLGNHTLVGRCISNLIDNALKFSKPGIPPLVQIWSEPIHNSGPSETRPNSHSGDLLSESRSHTSTPESHRVRLWFQDNGIGISREAQRKIFGIFERGDRAGEFEGTGIGLAIVSRAMERMGGECGVESTPGEGSRFWLEFCKPESAP